MFMYLFVMCVFHMESIGCEIFILGSRGKGRYNEKFNYEPPKVSVFLRSRPDFKWIYYIYCNEYYGIKYLI